MFYLFVFFLRKFRNENEKRRRDLFSQLISSLENILNIDKTSSSVIPTTKLDKASILRETVVYLKKHHHGKIDIFNIDKTNLNQ